MSIRELLRMISPSVIGAIGGGFVSYRFLYWNVPRYDPLWPSLLVSLAGCALAGWAVTRVTNRVGISRFGLLFVSGFLGAVLFLYAAVKIGTPGHASVVVVCDGLGVATPSSSPDADELEKWMERRGLEYEPSPPPATAWPKHFFVSQEGSVSWLLYGKPGTKVTVKFDRGYDPFSVDPSRQSEFHGFIPFPLPPNDSLSEGRQFPGIIVAGPVVRAGRGAYSISIEYPPDARGVIRTEEILVHGGESPKRRG